MKIKKIIYFTLLISFISLALISFNEEKCYCKSSKVNNLTSIYAENNYNNLLNGGFSAESKDYIYYSNFSDKGCLYKIKKDGSGKIKLATLGVSYINIYNNYIYYIGYSNSKQVGIYRIDLDGKNNKLLWNIRNEKKYWISIIKNNPDFKDRLNELIKTQGDIRNLTVINNKIYFISAIDSHLKSYVRILDLNGKLSKTIVLNVPPTSISINSNWIYYWNTANSVNKSPLYRINESTLKQQCLFNNYIYNMQIYNNKLYFYPAYTNKLICCNLDGSSKKTLSTNFKSFGNFIINNNKLYFTSFNDSKLCCLPINSNKMKSICAINFNDSFSFNICNNYLFVKSYSDNFIDSKQCIIDLSNSKEVNYFNK